MLVQFFKFHRNIPSFRGHEIHAGRRLLGRQSNQARIYIGFRRFISFTVSTEYNLNTVTIYHKLIYVPDACDLERNNIYFRTIIQRFMIHLRL